MIMRKQYYEAYDDRYRQVHDAGLQWFADQPTGIVREIITRFGINKNHKLLEIGCGEGRDAFPLLRDGYNLLATDISEEVIRYNRERWPEFSNSFAVLDCISGEMADRFDFIYAVAVVHMLVEDVHRNAFYSFIREHLTPDGIGLICTMGDGTIERQSDIRNAFQKQDRVHEQTGKQLKIASTSCRMVSFDTFHTELAQNGLTVLEEGITQALPDFSMLMYAVVKGEKHDL